MILSWHVLYVTEENHETSVRIQSPGRGQNLGPPENHEQHYSGQPVFWLGLKPGPSRKCSKIVNIWTATRFIVTDINELKVKHRGYFLKVRSRKKIRMVQKYVNIKENKESVKKGTRMENNKEWLSFCMAVTHMTCRHAAREVEGPVMKLRNGLPNWMKTDKTGWKKSISCDVNQGK